MSNGSGSAMMLEIRCQLVYLMPGATDFFGVEQRGRVDIRWGDELTP